MIIIGPNDPWPLRKRDGKLERIPLKELVKSVAYGEEYEMYFFRFVLLGENALSMLLNEYPNAVDEKGINLFHRDGEPYYCGLKLRLLKFRNGVELIEVP